MRAVSRWGVAALGLLLAAGPLQGCRKEGCLGGEAGCRLPSPCQKLVPTCEPQALQVQQLDAGERAPGGGLDALGGHGDVVLSNGRVSAVIAGIGNANYLDPNGGSLLDLSNVGANNDGLNQVLQVVGILPADAARYTSLEIISEPERVGVQVRGTLDGRPELAISTLYELRACDDGVRMRTEIANGSADPALWSLSDGFYWSGREALPFTPAAGTGFEHPPFSLLTIDDAYERFPFLAASTHGGPNASYADVSCNTPALDGFQSDQVSNAGLPRTVVPPRGHLVFERYLAVAPGGDVASAADLALAVRHQLFGEQYVTLKGRVERVGGAALANPREVSVLVSTAPGCKAGGALDAKVCKQASASPWTQIQPSADGSFSAKVPSGVALRLEVHAFGEKQLERSVDGLSADGDVGTLTLPSTARVNLAVMDLLGAVGVDAEVFVVPADDATRKAVQGTFHGRMESCAPWLGPPSGGSPACNRILVADGQASVELPVGVFHFYAFKGPFWTLQRQTVTLTPTTTTLTFALEHLLLQPTGSVSADLHVHGAASFDSSIPDLDRVRSFSATGLDVIVATDHDVATDYAQTLSMLGLSGGMTAIIGTETTGHIPFFTIPHYGFPLVIGHYNFWPLRYQPGEPHRGTPNDERLEPGALFDAMASRFDSQTPVIQLNHPWATPEFGRDLGYPRALALNTLKDLPESDDGTSGGMYVRTPNGKAAAAAAANNGHHAQEVMNGSSNESLLQYRAFWFYLLSQGQLRTGTANSDSHSLTDNTVGIPRNVVFASTQAGPLFNVETFNTAIRQGRVLGTNGPIIEARVDGQDGLHDYSLQQFAPATDAKVHLKVSAAPWVPVEEVRFVVNGRVVKRLTAPQLSQPADPFGRDGLVRYQGDVALAELLTSKGDAWLVIEAGRVLPLAADLGGVIDDAPDGIPDTSDNNGDGVVDSNDVEAGSKSGPLSNPPTPPETDPAFHFSQVENGGYPFAFTNPFILDRDGNGRFDPPRVAKAGTP